MFQYYFTFNTLQLTLTYTYTYTLTPMTKGFTNNQKKMWCN